MKRIVGALALCLSTCAGPQVAAQGLPDTKTMMGRVERILVANGYPDAWGYAKTAAPTVTLVERLPNDDWGHYIPGDIKISTAQPEGCLVVTLGHELGHDATVKMGLISLERGAPAWLVKQESERITTLVESHIASDGVWLPNCLMRRSHAALRPMAKGGE